VTPKVDRVPTPAVRAPDDDHDDDVDPVAPHGLDH
jgi:hypothetical protein